MRKRAAGQPGSEPARHQAGLKGQEQEECLNLSQFMGLEIITLSLAYHQLGHL